MSRTKYRFVGRKGPDYVWESTDIHPGEVSTEQIRCRADWFWNPPWVQRAKVSAAKAICGEMGAHLWSEISFSEYRDYCDLGTAAFDSLGLTEQWAVGWFGSSRGLIPHPSRKDASERAAYVNREYPTANARVYGRLVSPWVPADGGAV